MLADTIIELIHAVWSQATLPPPPPPSRPTAVSNTLLSKYANIAAAIPVHYRSEHVLSNVQRARWRLILMTTCMTISQQFDNSSIFYALLILCCALLYALDHLLHVHGSQLIVAHMDQHSDTLAALLQALHTHSANIHTSGVSQFQQDFIDYFHYSDDELMESLILALGIYTELLILHANSQQEYTVQPMLQQYIQLLAPHSLFLHCLSLFDFDVSSLLDLLIEPDSNFLLYITLYMKWANKEENVQFMKQQVGDLYLMCNPVC